MAQTAQTAQPVKRRTPGREPGRGREVARVSPGTEDVLALASRSTAWTAALESTVTGLGYDLVDLERLPRGLMRVSIDRIPGRAYPIESDFVTVDDCELVTRQLQLLLEVENVPYERLEVSSPGLDRPLRKPADWDRFCGLEIDVTFKLAFEGRKKYRGLLLQSQPQPQLLLREGKTEQTLDFELAEVREARLVPVVDFKGRPKSPRTGEQQP